MAVAAHHTDVRFQPGAGTPRSRRRGPKAPSWLDQQEQLHAASREGRRFGSVKNRRVETTPERQYGAAVHVGTRRASRWACQRGVRVERRGQAGGELAAFCDTQVPGRAWFSDLSLLAEQRGERSIAQHAGTPVVQGLLESTRDPELLKEVRNAIARRLETHY